VESVYGEGRRLTYLDRLGEGRDSLSAQAQFPDLLLQLLLGEEGWLAGADGAAADPRQALARPTFDDPEPLRSLSPWLALFMALLFAAERWLSERPAREERP